MNDKSICPYCNYENEIITDDLIEGAWLESECEKCGKYYLERIEVEYLFYAETKKYEGELK